ncbi:SWIM zinc finger family protein [Parasulfitobacter algicola]|uniref:SWIM zinc finger family protein n=1 Tax=Parasulfitobacter algicola TaxID=2614809 RepID=A0ABX2ITA9_9RHOB|nr:SWIM zinc finger family protein [Sulfitobacter algicola]NSX53428.1 SWIM zinc finger family protein [Sulfitobacter algicola]
MTPLGTMLATYDEAALIAALSKGAIIRARKDVAANKVSILEQTDNAATLTVDAETLTLDAKDLFAARCTCPAAGLCRHIAAAVLFLREQTPASSVKPTEPAPVFDINLIEKFARKEWPNALALTNEPLSIQTDGSTQVTFTETQDIVTFPVGQTLAKALYKGPSAARKKRAIAAAALALLREAGQDLPELVEASIQKEVSSDVLDSAADGLLHAALALSSGTIAQARDRLFSLAISTRAETVPRLAAELRTLSQRLDPDRLRSAQETPIDLFYGLSRTFALTEALREHPSDPALVGVLARSFIPSGPMRLTFLGAEHWQTPTGARGLTCVFLNLETGQTHRTVEARGAGTDFRFNPRDAWRAPLWSLVTPSSMTGTEVILKDAARAYDGGLGLTQTATSGRKDIHFDDLQKTGAIKRDWSQLPTCITDDLGRGLRQRPGEAFVILEAENIETPVFDPFDQQWVWTWRDTEDRAITLRFPENNPPHIDTFNHILRRIRGGLVALHPNDEARTGRLISLWISGKDGGLRSLQFDTLPRPKGLSGVIDRFIERTVVRSDSTALSLNQLHLFFERLTEAVLTSLSGTPIPNRLTEDARDLGQSTVLRFLEQMEKDTTPATALRLTYLLSEGARLS